MVPQSQYRLDRVRKRLKLLNSGRFDYKEALLDPVDRRPCGYNAAADHVANCVLARDAGMGTAFACERE